jgi:hypothetical protein
LRLICFPTNIALGLMIGVDLAIAVPPHPAPMAAKAPPLEALSATEAIKSFAPTPVAF